MKAFKMLGLAALAALMAMAFVGASSAMAESTILCSADENEACLQTNQITHVHEATLAGSQATLLSSVGNITCDALYLGDAEAGTSTPLVINGAFTYTNCKRSGSENCTVTQKSANAKVEVLREGHETAKVTGSAEVKVVCGIFISCVYDGEGLKGTGKGPLLSSETNGSVSISEQTTHKVGSGICPSEGKLDITTTPLSATYITKTGPMECVSKASGLYETNAGGGVCTNDVYEKRGKFELTTSGTMECISKVNGLYTTKVNSTECSNDVLPFGAWELRN